MWGGQHFLVKTYLIKYYKQSLLTYFCFNPFKLAYSCFDIRLELTHKFSVFNWFPNTFVPHYHQKLLYVGKSTIHRFIYTGVKSISYLFIYFYLSFLLLF